MLFYLREWVVQNIDRSFLSFVEKKMRGEQINPFRVIMFSEINSEFSPLE